MLYFPPILLLLLWSSQLSLSLLGPKLSLSALWKDMWEWRYFPRILTSALERGKGIASYSGRFNPVTIEVGKPKSVWTF